MGVSLALATICTILMLSVIRQSFKIKQNNYTSVLQGGIRQNSYIGLAAAGPLYGAGGEALAAVGILAVIPLVNVISVISLLQIKKSKELSHLALIKQSRLSVMPIDSKSWKILNKMSKV